MELYKEIILPSLVNDVRSIYWEHIDPLGMPSYDPNRTLRYVKINVRDSKQQALVEILEKYPFLTDHLLLFKLPPGHNTGIHMDGLGDKLPHRNFSCNIAIEGSSTNGKTEFYDVKQSDFFFDTTNTTRFLKPGASAVKIDEYALQDNPILVNTQIPHCVNNTNSETTRVSVSWTVHSRWSWDMIANFIDNEV